MSEHKEHEPVTLSIGGMTEKPSEAKVHKILDLLDLPKGTQVTLSHGRASSVIVR